MLDTCRILSKAIHLKIMLCQCDQMATVFLKYLAIYSNKYLPNWIIFFAEVGTKFCQILQILSKSFENSDKFFKNCQIRSHWICHFLLMQGLCFIESKLLAVKISENILSFTTDYRQFKKQLLQNPNKSFPSSSTHGSDLVYDAAFLGSFLIGRFQSSFFFNFQYSW